MNGGGIERFLLRYISYYNDNNSDRVINHVFVIHDKNRGIVEERLVNYGYKVYRIPSKKENLVQFIVGLVKLIKLERIHIFHVHQNYSGWLAILIGKILGRFVICHGHQYYQSQPLINKIHNAVVRPIILLSNYRIACTVESANWLYKGKCDLVLPYSMELDLFRFNPHYKNQILKELGIDDTPIIGHIGRISHQKNQFFLLDVFREILRIAPKAHLIFVGEGELSEDVREYGEDIANISWIPPREDIHKFYSAFDLFLLPSNWEGLGIVAIESQANGLPTVVSDVLPKDLDQTELLHRVSLSKTPSFWAKKVLEILSRVNDNNRLEYNEILKEGKYNIHNGVDKLFSVYANN